MFHTFWVTSVPKTCDQISARKEVGHPFFKYSWDTGAYPCLTTFDPRAVLSASKELNPGATLGKYGFTPSKASPLDNSAYWILYNILFIFLNKYKLLVLHMLLTNWLRVFTFSDMCENSHFGSPL